MMMTGFELRLWRRGLNWDQEKAAHELGISSRSYKRYEKSSFVSRLVELASRTLEREATEKAAAAKPQQP